MLTILITGVGGPLGQGLIKAARAAAIPCRIIGTDRFRFSAGFRWVDKSYVLSDSASESEYLQELGCICQSEGPSLIFPGSENELEVLARHAPELSQNHGALPVTSSPQVLSIALDKWKTCCLLRDAGLDYPRSILLGDAAGLEAFVKRHGFPLIAKPCRSSGSIGVCAVRSWKEIDALKNAAKPMLLQEYLTPDEQEYTTAVYTLKNGRAMGAISLRRDLVCGNTYRAWVASNPAIDAAACAVVEALNPRGPCNVQLRMTERGPVAFEINPRFSGTVSMRAHFGYNEVEMAIRDLVLNEKIPPPVIKNGVALRYWEELYLTDPEHDLPADHSI